LFEYLQEDYFWYQDLPASFDPEAYPDLFSAMDALRVDQDRFSYVLTREDYDAFFVDATFFGYGFGHTRTDENDWSSYSLRI
jgi:hypothetical protein